MRDALHVGMLLDVQRHGSEARRIRSVLPRQSLVESIVDELQNCPANSPVKSNWRAGTPARRAWRMWPRRAPCLSCLRAMPPSAA